MKEKIQLMIQLLYQEKNQEACQMLMQCIPEMERCIQHLDGERQNLVIMALGQVLKAMEEQKNIEMARILQYELLPALYEEESCPEISSVQAAAEGFAMQYANMDKEAVLLVYGYGDGTYPEAIMKGCGQDVKVVFYEPAPLHNEEIVRNMQSLTKAYSNCYIISMVPFQDRGYELADLPKVLKNLVFYHNRNQMQMCALPGYKENFQEQYGKYWKTVELHMQLIQTNLQNAKAMGHIAVENNIRILSYIPDSYCLDAFDGKFAKEMPAVIVSAGPSLEKNVRMLHKAKNHALLVCVDTAVRVLLKENIIPDVVVTVDPRKELALFDDIRMKDIPIVGSTDMSAKVLKYIQCKRLILASVKYPFVKELYAQYGHCVKELESGGSVATLAYSFCREVGIRRIILVGQDLALTGDKMYAGRNALNLNQFQRELIEVEDVDGGTINTTRDYYYYLKWFEQRIAMHNEVEVIDATEGGAKIHGSIICPLESALEQYAAPEYDMDGILNSLEPAFKKKDHDKILNCIQHHKDAYQEWIDKFEYGMELLQQGIQGWESREGDALAKNQQWNQKLMKLCGDFDASDVRFLIQREIDATDLQEYLQICEASVEPGTKEHYALMQRYFQCLLKATRSVANVISTES